MCPEQGTSCAPIDRGHLCDWVSIWTSRGIPRADPPGNRKLQERPVAALTASRGQLGCVLLSMAEAGGRRECGTPTLKYPDCS